MIKTDLIVTHLEEEPKDLEMDIHQIKYIVTTLDSEVKDIVHYVGNYALFSKEEKKNM